MINPLKLLQIILTVVLLISTGFFAKKIRIAKKEHSKILNNIIIYVTLPALIFTSVTKANLSFDLIKMPIVANVTMATLFLLAYLIGKKLKFDKKLFGSFLLVAVVGNTGYLGYPLAQQIASNDGLTRAIFYDIFGTVIFILTVGLIVAEIYGGKSHKINKIKELLTFPPLLALMLTFVLKSITLPLILIDGLSILGIVTIPLIMFSIGLSLEVSKITDYKLPIFLALLLKLLISPIIAFLYGNLFSLGNNLILIVVLEAAMPSALLSLVFGIKYELKNSYIASTIFVLTVASAITVPLILFILVV